MALLLSSLKLTLVTYVSYRHTRLKFNKLNYASFPFVIARQNHQLLQSISANIVTHNWTVNKPVIATVLPRYQPVISQIRHTALHLVGRDKLDGEKYRNCKYVFLKSEQFNKK